jgi:hypothetical protein
MKLSIALSKKEAELLNKVMKAYDFEDKVSCEKLSRKYREGNEAGSFEYSGLTDHGVEIKFETHEKLLKAACEVYLKYATQVNSIICGIKSLVMGCKSLFKNFESDYKAELNNAFKEIEDEAKVEKIRKEAKAKAEEEIKRTFDRIKQVEDEKDDDDELY